MFDRTEEAQMEKSSYFDALTKRTKLERLRDMRKGLEGKLEEVNNAIRLLEGNPHLTEVIDALEKINA